MAVAVSSHLHVVCFHPSGLSRKILHIADPGVCVCVCACGGGGLGAWVFGTSNWHPVRKKIFPKMDTPS